MTLSDTAVSMNACNSQGTGCGSKTVKVTLQNAAAGATVSATKVPANLRVTLTSQAGGVYTFVIAAYNSTRTKNSVEFTGTNCGLPKVVSVTTK